ncbi:hypothetical protein B0H94_10820 [Salsuginibacillus halophilus]|uniref:Uncharacterized protein n=1 Tax=Salsuginibacillus halophilus TaxID=517424 RepID=A0A2P8HDV1_9BACI|nr:hypothetical protein [Salsuginibacillus halophilus]PSL44410.1 hypothetical protein B0H94_10820 [Salsuginibacillus halophilus]
MAGFLVDHHHKEVHRTTFMNDRCNVLKLPPSERITKLNEGEVQALLDAYGYQKCTCFDGPEMIATHTHELLYE